MSFPLSLWDISLWLAMTAMMLLLASGLLSTHYNKAKILISKKRLRNAALTASLLFLATVATRIISIILKL